jgi:hypothetical protein
MASKGRRKCKCCQQLFRPDPRNRHHQRYCATPDCRAASKAASQARWRAAPENQDYFRGALAVARVRAWRSRHPGYWRKGPRSGPALQDVLPAQPVDTTGKTADFAGSPLQEIISAQSDVLIGLIAHIAGTPLQDEITSAATRLLRLGREILASPPRERFPPASELHACVGHPMAMSDGAAGRDRLRDLLQNPRLP